MIKVTTKIFLLYLSNFSTDLILVLNSGDFGQALDPDEKREEEGGRLSGSGLGDADDVAILKTDRNCLTLNRRWLGISDLQNKKEECSFYQTKSLKGIIQPF